MGRPSTLTPERAEKIFALIREGNTRRCAAECNGVAYNTLRQWVRFGRAGQEPYAAFAAGLEEAESASEAWHVANIRRHADGSWQASAWWLERVRFKTFGRRDVSYENMKRAEREAQRAQLAEIPLEELERMVVAEKARRAREAATKASDVGALQ